MSQTIDLPPPEKIPAAFFYAGQTSWERTRTDGNGRERKTNERTNNWKSGPESIVRTNTASTQSCHALGKSAFRQKTLRLRLYLTSQEKARRLDQQEHRVGNNATLALSIGTMLCPLDKVPKLPVARNPPAHKLDATLRVFAPYSQTVLPEIIFVVQQQFLQRSTRNIRQFQLGSTA